MNEYKTWGRSRAVRLDGGYYLPHQPIHVVIATHRRHPWFADHGLARCVFGVITDQPATLAACLMPDHLHWLLRVEDSLPAQVSRFKSWSTRLANPGGGRARLWQRSFFDHAVRREERLKFLAQYIIENPVRAGLVARAEDYEFVVVRLEQ